MICETRAVRLLSIVQNRSLYEVATYCLFLDELLELLKNQYGGCTPNSQILGFSLCGLHHIDTSSKGTGCLNGLTRQANNSESNTRVDQPSFGSARSQGHSMLHCRFVHHAVFLHSDK
jgi:hypothetical protein